MPSASRYACLLVSDVPLAAALRAEPELRSQALAVVDGQEILSGWLHGMTLTQARAIAPNLVTRPVSLEGIASIQNALIDVALSVTPRVEDVRSGLAFLELAGTEVLYPTEKGLLTALDTRLRSVGIFDVRSGTAPTRTASQLAARFRDGGHIVRARDLQKFLAPLPLDLLDPSDELSERLTHWGLQRLSDLWKLPNDTLGTRLGRAGVELARRARGADLKPFKPTPPRLRFEESAQPEYPLGNLEQLSFLLRGVLDRLARRLQVRGIAIRELLLELTLENHETFARSVPLGAPTTEVSVLLSLVRLTLERDPPSAAVELVRVTATPGNIETAQLDLFLPPLPAPAELATTVARLEALCGGTDRVGALGVRDTHRPDAGTLDSFATDARPGDIYGNRVLAPRAAMALRSWRPPAPVRVCRRAGSPARLELRGKTLRVERAAGPWRLFGEWWGDGRFARDYFDVELSDGGVYRLYENLDEARWFIDGLYD